MHCITVTAQRLCLAQRKKKKKPAELAMSLNSMQERDLTGTRSDQKKKDAGSQVVSVICSQHMSHCIPYCMPMHMYSRHKQGANHQHSIESFL